MMNFPKVLNAIAAIAILCCFIALMKLGLDMHLVTEWRMDGERAKANAFLFSRGSLIILLLIIGQTAITLSDKVEAKMKTKAYQEA